MRHGRATMKMFAVMFLAAVLGMSVGNELQAKTAIISRQGDTLHVTYYSNPYSLRRVPDYPLLHYYRHDVRANGSFDIYWDSPSRINRWTRW